MSEVCSDKVTSTQIFSHGSDSTDSDFIQEHIESFFLQADSEKEVIEDNEEASGPVVSVIAGEVEDAGEADEILDMLLYREYDEDEGEFEDRTANCQVLDKPQRTGIHTEMIQLIPWIGFEMDEIDEDGPDDWIFSEWVDYVIDLVDDALDMLVAGFAYVRDLVQTLGEMIVEWGMRVIDAIGEAFSTVRDAVSEVGEMVSALAEWIEDKVSGLFSSVWERVTSGLESWAEGIQEAMEKFFEELAEWDEMDGSESMEDTMEAGSALMLSFIGLQDKASPLMDVVERVMSFIEPFQQYISPFGAIRAISNAVGAERDGGEGIFDAFTDLGALGIEYIWDTITGSPLLEDALSKEINLGTTVPSVTAMKNFLEEADLPGLPIASQVIEFLPEEGEVSETISIEMALLLGMGLSVYGAHYSSDMASLSIFTNILSWIFNILSWVVEGVWGIFYGGLAFTTGAISFLSGILAGTIKGPQIVVFVSSPMIGIFLALSQME